MALYLSYESLEKKIKQIKNDVENLWQTVDRLSNRKSQESIFKNDVSSSNSISSYHTAICCSFWSLDSFVTALGSVNGDPSDITIHNVVDGLTDENDIGERFKDEEVSENSHLSFHTPLTCSHLSLDPLMNFDELEKNQFDIGDKSMSISVSQISKKSVSFSNQITVLESTPKEFMTNKTKTKIKHIKHKVIDYIYREKFYLKYKLQQFKNNIKNNQKPREKSIGELEKTGAKQSFDGDNVEVKKYREVLIDWKIFFSQYIVNFIFETDIDRNSLSLIGRECSFQQTDLTTPTLERKLILNSDGQSKQDKENMTKNGRIIRRNKIQPKLMWTNVASPDLNSVKSDIFYQYLVTKAQYPIQLKIAKSIIKLNLPVWYQSCLIE